MGILNSPGKDLNQGGMIMTDATVYRFTEPLGDPGTFVESATQFIEKHVADDEKVVCALSGGVDSSVTAMVFNKAIGDRLYPIHFDTGFMRRIRGVKEVKQVADWFGDLDNFELIDKSELFQENVFGMENSEKKRKAFRSTYEQVLNEKIDEIGAKVITQGTIRPDIMETEGQIKSQNNVDTDFDVEKMVEPITSLYKPHVRLLAKELELPQEIYYRQPFPGPGLSVRTVGTINEEKLENEKIANDLVEQFIEEYFEENYGKPNLWDGFSGSRIPFQYFAGTFDGDVSKNNEISDYLKGLGLEAEAYTLENSATGVKETEGGRNRVYAPPVVLKGDLKEETVYPLGKRIPERFEVSRVLYQLAASGEGEWITSIRAVDSEDAIDAQPLAVPFKKLTELGEEIVQGTDSFSAAYDVSPKPPATIEYE